MEPKNRGGTTFFIKKSSKNINLVKIFILPTQYMYVRLLKHGQLFVSVKQVRGKKTTNLVVFFF